MHPKHTHKHILLHKNQSGQVEYCESCDVVEMAIGPVSLRIHAQDLTLLHTLIQEAEARLRDYHAQKAQHEADMLQVRALH